MTKTDYQILPIGSTQSLAMAPWRLFRDLSYAFVDIKLSCNGGESSTPITVERHTIDTNHGNFDVIAQHIGCSSSSS